MKKYLKPIIILAALNLMSSSCSEKLELQPHQQIDETTALSTQQDVEVTLNGAYDRASSVNLYGGAIQYIGDFLGDDGEFRFGGTYASLDEIWRKAITTSNAQIQSTWMQAYSTINIANNVLSALDIVSEEKRDEIEGKALFLRGLVYFDLVRLWAKDYNDGSSTSNLGVPIVLTPTRGITAEDLKARNTVAEVYAQIIDDLTTAASLLSSAVETGFASKGTAQAILARVYLQQGNYEAARDAANEVIESGNYSLASSFTDIFTDASAETIFSLVVTDQDGVNDLNTFYAPSNYQGRGDVRVLEKHFAMYEDDDKRGSFFVSASNNTLFYTAKFLDRYGDVLVVRLAEMYLIRAETNLRLGTTIGASPLADVNAIRERAGAVVYTTISLDKILNEREIELAFEGQQIYDVKRLKGTIGGEPFSADRFVLPIPQREIDVNKNLVQNPGYN